MNAQKDLVAELKSAAKTLSVDGIGNTRTHKLAAELLDRAALALGAAYTPAQMAAAFRAGLNTERLQRQETLQLMVTDESIEEALGYFDWLGDEAGPYAAVVCAELRRRLETERTANDGD